jgi:hypothetical protein
VVVAPRPAARCVNGAGTLWTPSVSVVTGRQNHADQAELLRRVLDAFPPEDDRSADRAIRRRVEGAVVACELAAGEPAPRLADAKTGDPPSP